jgi:protein MAK11
MADAEDANGKAGNAIAVSTEDGKIIFFSTLIDHELSTRGSDSGLSVPMARRMGQLGGKAAGITSRIKDFVLLPLSPSRSRNIEQPRCLMVTGSSDGTVRIWGLDLLAILRSAMEPKESSSQGKINGSGGAVPTQFGRLYGTFETGLRITCLTAFVMSGNLENEDCSKKAKSDAAAESHDTMDNANDHRDGRSLAS